MITHRCDRCNAPTSAPQGMATLTVAYGSGDESRSDERHLCDPCSADLVRFLTGLDTIEPPAKHPKRQSSPT
jgi:hypothetical protein